MAQRNSLSRLVEIDRQIRANEYPNPRTLAAEFGVSERTIYEDRRFLLDELSAPLVFSRKHKGWYYSKSTWTLPTVNISLNELLAFALAIEAARHALGASFEAELQSAARKICEGLQGKSSIDLESLRGHFIFAATSPSVISPVITPNLLELSDAIANRHRVRVLYFSARSNTTKWRLLEPHGLQNAEGEWRCFAFEPASNEMRTFNLARMKRLETKAQTFVPQPSFNVETFLRESFRHELGPVLHSIAVRFDASQAPYIREKRWHPTQTIEEEANGSLVLRFQARGLGEIARWVLSYGAHAEVLEPPALRQAVFEAAQALVARYTR